MATKAATVTELQLEKIQPKLSVAQLEKMLATAKAEQAALLTPERKAEIIEEIEAYVSDKWNGLTLADLGLAEKTQRKMPDPTTYIHPVTKKEYVYKGWGAFSGEVKEWLFKDANGNKLDKPNPDYLKKA